MSASFADLILDDLGRTHNAKNPFQLGSADLNLSDNSGLYNKMTQQKRNDLQRFESGSINLDDTEDRNEEGFDFGMSQD